MNKKIQFPSTELLKCRFEDQYFFRIGWDLEKKVLYHA